MAEPPNGPVKRPVGHRERWQRGLHDVGCFLPFVAPPVALGIGWWLGGVWAGLGSTVLVGVLTLWLFHRLFGSGAILEMGCTVLLILILLALLFPVAQMIRQAAERRRAERETGWQASPSVTWASQKDCGTND